MQFIFENFYFMLTVKPISQHLRYLNFALSIEKVYKLKKGEMQFPMLQIAISSAYKKIDESVFEVVIMLSCTSEEEKFFNISCEYSGLFDIQDYQNEEALDVVINGYCAGFVFPFLRAKIANLSFEAGLQTIMLEPIDFYAAFKKQKEDALAEQEGVEQNEEYEEGEN